jgi:hypothetical protein
MDNSATSQNTSFQSVQDDKFMFLFKGVWNPFQKAIIRRKQFSSKDLA